MFLHACVGLYFFLLLLVSDWSVSNFLEFSFTVCNFVFRKSHSGLKSSINMKKRWSLMVDLSYFHLNRMPHISVFLKKKKLSQKKLNFWFSSYQEAVWWRHDFFLLLIFGFWLINFWCMVADTVSAWDDRNDECQVRVTTSLSKRGLQCCGKCTIFLVVLLWNLMMWVF